MKTHTITILCGAFIALVYGAHAAKDNSRFTNGNPFQILDDQIQANSADIKDNAEAIASNSSTLSLIETSIEEIQGQIVAMNQELDALDARVDSNQARIAELKSAYVDLLAQMEAADAALAAAVEANTTTLAALKAEVAEAQAAVTEAIANNSNNIDALQDALLEAAQAFNTQAAANGTEIDALFLELEELADQSNENAQAITELSNAHNADILATNEKLDEIAVSLNTQIVALQEEISGLLGQEWASQEDLNALQFLIINNLNQIIALQAQVNSATSQNHYHEFALSYQDYHVLHFELAYDNGHYDVHEDLFWNDDTKTNELAYKIVYDNNDVYRTLLFPLITERTATGSTGGPTSL